MRNFNDIVLRPATQDDSARDIARLIYLTDPYIYPFLCADPADEAWVDFIRRALGDPMHVHGAQNLLVAQRGEAIVGLICAYRLPSNKRFLLPVDAAIAQRYAAVWEGYYKHSPSSEESLYISNLCVDPAARGRGIGGALLGALLENHKNERVTLDVLAENTAAIALYKRAGFEIVSSYRGFSGASDTPVKCYSMLKQPS